MSAPRSVVAIAMRELRAQLGTPLAWGAAAGFLLLGGLAFFQRVIRFEELLARYAVLAELSGSDASLALLNLNEVVILGLYRHLLLLLLFLAPLLSMRAFAEDRASGVEEWLLTSPLTPGQLVLGKFVGVVVVALAIVAGSGAFVAVLFHYGDPEPGPAWSGLVGLVLGVAALVSIGLATSAWSRSQGLAATASLVAGLGLFLLDAPSRTAPPVVARFLDALSLPARFEPMGRGLITGSDVAYFASLIAIGLFAARLGLATRRWS